MVEGRCVENQVDGNALRNYIRTLPFIKYTRKFCPPPGNHRLEWTERRTFLSYSSLVEKDSASFRVNPWSVSPTDIDENGNPELEAHRSSTAITSAEMWQPDYMI
jgi:hypothetical protein